MVKNLPASAGDMGSIPGLGRSPGGGNRNRLQHSCLGNPTTEEPGGLQSTGSQRVQHDLATYQQLLTTKHRSSLWFLGAWLSASLLCTQMPPSRPHSDLVSAHSRATLLLALLMSHSSSSSSQAYLVIPPSPVSLATHILPLP